jgi:hypothetical protein
VIERVFIDFTDLDIGRLIDGRWHGLFRNREVVASGCVREVASASQVGRRIYNPAMPILDALTIVRAMQLQDNQLSVYLIVSNTAPVANANRVLKSQVSIGWSSRDRIALGTHPTLEPMLRIVFILIPVFLAAIAAIAISIPT